MQTPFDRSFKIFILFPSHGRILSKTEAHAAVQELKRVRLPAFANVELEYTR